MNTGSKVYGSMIEQALLSVHTAYLAKVISVSGGSAKIQPLNMIKAVGQAAVKQAAITAPIARNVKKFGSTTVTIEGNSFTVPTVSNIESGDIVVCVCGERDITEALKGKCAVPPKGHHRISDSLIVGVL